MDRIELTESRIREILKSGPDSWAPEMRGYFEEMFSFAALLCDTWHILEYPDDLDTAELASINARLYAGIGKDRYDTSYVNPAFSVSRFGTETGRLLAAFGAELRAAIPALYVRDADALSMRLKLLLDVYSAYTEGTNGDCAVSPETLRGIFYDYAHDNWARETLHKLTAQLDPGSALLKFDIASKSMRLRAGDLIRAMYLSGEYIGANETGMIRTLCALDDAKLESMADTFVTGYVKGFEVTGRDLSRKKTAEFRFNLGFLPMMVLAARKLSAMGLKISMMRAGYSIFTGRSVDKNGVFGGNPNPQFDFDHKNDLSLILDKKLNDHRVECLKKAYDELDEQASVYAGPAVVEIFGDPEFVPVIKPEAADHDASTRPLVTEYSSQAGYISNDHIPGDERSFTIIAFPVPTVAYAGTGAPADGSDPLADESARARFTDIMDATIAINTLDYELYRDIQQKIIDVLDTAGYVSVTGRGDNRTQLKICLCDLRDPARETRFENCVADVNIPVGEVFTSPKLTGTEGVLHVTHVYLNGIEYHDLELEIRNGMIVRYGCEEGDKLIEDNILFHHDTLPMGEFAIGTNTTAYVFARKYGIEAILPILIAEKTGPHFAFGDTCYSNCEDLKVYNPDGKEIIARDNECSLLRNTDISKAYFNCHTDITIPYDELGAIKVHRPDGSIVPIITDGRFVLPGCEELNRPFDV